MFAHVRAVTPGGHRDDGKKEGKEDGLDVPFYGAVSEQNCHPFRHQQFTFMHNGGLSGFTQVKRALLNLLEDYIFNAIDGNTDSEHCFGVFLTLARHRYEKIQARQVEEEEEAMGPLSQMQDMDFLANTTQDTINQLLELEYEDGVQSASSLNFAISDGVNVVATRCRNDTVQDAPSLYYCCGYCGHMSGADLKVGSCDTCKERRARGDPPTNVIVSSEPVTKNNDANWKLVPKNAMICIEGDPDKPGVIRSVTIRELMLNPAYMRENGRRSRSKMSNSTGRGRYATRLIDEFQMTEPDAGRPPPRRLTAPLY